MSDKIQSSKSIPPEVMSSLDDDGFVQVQLLSQDHLGWQVFPVSLVGSIYK